MALGVLLGTVECRGPVRTSRVLRAPLGVQWNWAMHRSVGSLPVYHSSIKGLQVRWEGARGTERGMVAEPAGGITAAPGTPTCYRVFCSSANQTSGYLVRCPQNK